jgi:hypothetical protein
VLKIGDAIGCVHYDLAVMHDGKLQTGDLSLPHPGTQQSGD